MRSRRCAFLAGASLLLFVLFVLSGLPAFGQAGASCAVFPWEEGAGAVSPVQPVQPNQPPLILETSCSSSSQCPSGQACHCGQCHPKCATGERWSCICQTCYQPCSPGYFFDPSLCACAPI